MKSLGAFLCLSAAIVLFAEWTPLVPSSTWGNETPLSQVLPALGDSKPHHDRSNYTTVQVKQGYEIVTKGSTIGPDGKPSHRISKFYTCTDCHNIQREDPDLTKSNPEARLAYAEANNLPFLQATTFWGMVNRRSWYNDDYIKKYGDLVLPTNDTLINAIQLCCKECSQGRRAETWELEAMLAYFHSIQMTLGDLALTDQDWQTLRNEEVDETDRLQLLQSKYLAKSPATFLEPRYGDQRGLGEDGNAANGKLIYERSCLHCHSGGTGVTTMTLEEDRLDYAFLSKHMRKNNEKSIYVITRRGTYAHTYYKPYMPLYPAERMSEQQLEDLAAFLSTSK